MEYLIIFTLYIIVGLKTVKVFKVVHDLANQYNALAKALPQPYCSELKLMPVQEPENLATFLSVILWPVFDCIHFFKRSFKSRKSLSALDREVPPK